jgi:peptidoglycan-associated lipoprotein
MLYRLLAIYSLILLLSSCATITAPIPEDDFEPMNMYEEQDFDILEDEDDAEDINEEVEEIIQETTEEIEVSDRVFFDLDQYEISSESRKVLDIQSEWLSSDLSISIIIEGHCDERGTREYNIALGEKRAISTKQYLIKNGIASSRIKTVSYGKERPAFVGSGESIWSKNRRSVVVVSQ